MLEQYSRPLPFHVVWNILPHSLHCFDLPASSQRAFAFDKGFCLPFKVSLVFFDIVSLHFDVENDLAHLDEQNRHDA